ncbi:MAG: hypothetical protein RML56_14890 [Burkholderiales bacterium]|nr:hypothetical protein [Burkholderiales bacterium]
MTEGVEKLILEHLRALRDDLQTLRNETREQRTELRSRVNSVEERLTWSSAASPTSKAISASYMPGWTGSRCASNASNAGSS